MDYRATGVAMRSGVWGRRRGANHTNLPSLNKLLGVESHRRVGVTDSGGKEAIEDRVLVFKRKGLFVLFSRHKIDRWGQCEICAECFGFD